MTSHYFYTPLTISELERKVKSHQEEFEILIGDSFSDDELRKYEGLLDSIAAISVQPMGELTFDDFYPDSKLEERQRKFFQECRSFICLENLPYLESNPVQVTYLIDLLWTLDEVLIDKGGISELIFKKTYLDELKKYKTMETLIDIPVEKAVAHRISLPLGPIDFLVQDVYRELDRLKGTNFSEENLSEKAQKILHVMISEKLDSESIYRKSGLTPKDFDDHLERVKFFLKKL